MQKILLSIPQPCHEAWDVMTPTDKGKFCASCAKEVVDFSAMTDTELMRYFANLQTANVCGRVYSDQLNRQFSSPLPAKKIKWYWQLAISLGLMIGKSQASEAQVKPAITASPGLPVVNNDEKVIVVGGLRRVHKPLPKMISVVDDEVQPIAYASVHFTRTDKYIATDSMGRFDAAGYEHDSLVISSVGYETKTIVLDKAADKIGMAAGNKTLGEVRMVATLQRHLTGAMVVCRYYKSSWTDTLKSVLPFVKPSLTVFPNPVQKGGTVNIQLPAKKTGPYMLQISDATGKVLLQQEVCDKTLVAAVKIPAVWADGTYFIRMMNGKGKLSATGKLLVKENGYKP